MKLFPFCLGLVLLSGVSVLAAPLDTAKLTHPIRIACVGDSITAGVGAAGGKSYPNQLQKLLGDDWLVGNFGVSGRTLLRKGDQSYWKTAAFLKAQEFQPNAVIIMLGTNDTKPQNWVHQAEFAQDYADLIQTFLELPGKPQVYICRPTPVPEPGNFGINETNLQVEMKVLDDLAARFPVTLIDMHTALSDQPAMLPDRVHPSTAGAARMAQAAYLALTGHSAPIPSPVIPTTPVPAEVK